MDKNKYERFKETLPEYYDIKPFFNKNGRLCNYGSPDTDRRTGEIEGETVRVMADEWERFNQFAGRQHEIVNGVVVFNGELEPCMPDEREKAITLEETVAGLVFELVDKGVL